MFEVFLLGTGAAKPTIERFTSVYAIRYQGRIFLFDAGEGAQIRMAQGGVSPFKVEAVFLTHYHGDHVLGLPGLIFTMATAGRTKSLRIYGPKGIEEFSEVVKKIVGWHIPFKLEFVEVSPGDEIGRLVKVFKTRHTKNSVGYIFKEPDTVVIDKKKMQEFGIRPNKKLRLLKEGKKVVVNGIELDPEEWLIKRRGMSVAYTGDTDKSKRVEEAVRGVDILLHDSTFLHEDKERGHSSAREAAEVAKKAGVGVLILTHISPRYTTTEALDRLLNEAKEVFPKTYLASDLTKILAKKGMISISKIVR